MHFLINGQTEEVHGEVRLGERVRVDAVKLSRTATGTGVLFEDHPYEIVPGEIVGDVPADHTHERFSYSYDPDRRRVIATRVTRPLTPEELAERDRAAREAARAESDAQAGAMLYLLLGSFGGDGTLHELPPALQQWREQRAALE